MTQETKKTTFIVTIENENLDKEDKVVSEIRYSTELYDSDSLEKVLILMFNNIINDIIENSLVHGFEIKETS